MVTEIIKNTTKDFLSTMGFETEIEISQKEKVISIEISAEEAEYLIGFRGNNLRSLQHILGVILRRRIQEPLFLDLDINGYKKKRAEFLREIARNLAQKVRLTKQNLTLKPLPANERRIIHLELAGYPDITTESIGEDPERRLVVKPYP